MRADCVRFADLVDEAIPSVVFAPRDENDRDITGATIFVDGEPVDYAEGNPYELDPGRHVVKFVHRDYRDEAVTVTARAGERHRRIAVSLHPRRSPPPPAPAAGGPSRVPEIVLFSGSFLLLAGSAALGLTTQARIDELADTCGHQCQKDDVADVERRIVVADVALGAGIVAALAGTYLLLRSNTRGAARRGSLRAR